MQRNFPSSSEVVEFVVRFFVWRYSRRVRWLGLVSPGVFTGRVRIGPARGVQWRGKKGGAGYWSVSHRESVGRKLPVMAPPSSQVLGWGWCYVGEIQKSSFNLDSQLS